jgi:hypothetical protein
MYREVAQWRYIRRRIQEEEISACGQSVATLSGLASTSRTAPITAGQYRVPASARASI